MDLFRRFNTKHNFIEQPMFPLECGKPNQELPYESGACIILGTHPCWEEDLAGALSKYPDAKICGVNEAPKLMKCDHLATCHGDKIDKFVKLHEERYPDSPRPMIHLRDNMTCKQSEHIDHIKWPVRTMAGSGPFAAAAMVMMGYDPVIMCGCPMDGGGGYAFDDTHKSTRYDPRIGYESGEHNMIRSWHRCMKLFKEQFPDMAANIRSMSGVTKEIFGGMQ